MSPEINAKTIWTFLGLIAAVFVVSFGLLLLALLTGSSIWIWTSLAELAAGVAVAVFWLVKRLGISARRPGSPAHEPLSHNHGGKELGSGSRFRMFDRSLMVAVRRFLMNAPWWQLSLIVGLIAGPLFGAGMGIALSVTEGRSSDGWVPGFLGGVVFGVVAGAITGPIAAYQSQRTRSVLGPLSAEDYSVVLRAAGRGPLPADPELRRAAGRLAAYRVEVTTRMRAFTFPVLGLFFVLEAVQAVVTSAWYWLAAVFFALMLVQGWWEPRRLRRRIELLADPATDRR